MTLTEFLTKFYPLLLNREMDRIEKMLSDGTKIVAYRMGDMIRIDIKPNGN